MGYQESIMFCDNKQELKKLCMVLNSAKPEFEKWVEVYAIGKLKKEEKIAAEFEDSEFSLPKGTYFVWWGGDRHPYQSDDYLKLHMAYNYGFDFVHLANWNTVFIEYIVNGNEFLKDIDQNLKGELQENEHIFIIELDSEQPIGKDVIDAIINKDMSLDDKLKQAASMRSENNNDSKDTKNKDLEI